MNTSRIVWPIATVALLIALAISTVGRSATITARSQPATPDTTATDAVARQAVAAVNAALATGDEAGIDARFAPDVVGSPPHRSISTGQRLSPDLAGMKLALAEMRRYFPDATIVIEDLIVAGDKAAVRVTFRGTPDATAFGLDSAPGRPLEAGGVLFGRVAGGRVVEFWAYFDETELLSLVRAESGA